MIRLRNPKRDDASIMTMIRVYLLPFKRFFFPEASIKKEEIKKRLRKGTTFVTLKSNGELEGFCHVMLKNKQLWIDLLAVEKKSQGKGKGAALLKHAEQYGKKKGCRTVKLFVDEVNPGAQMFYRRQGYVMHDYVRHIHCYIYEKQLD